MANYNFRPAGFEDDSSDEDGFSFGDSFGKSNQSFQPSSLTSTTNTISNSRSGFGPAPPRQPPRNVPPHQSKPGFCRAEEHKGMSPKSKPVHQRSNDGLNVHGSSDGALQNGVSESPSVKPSWASVDTVPVDDFRMAVIRNNVEAVKEYLDQGLPVDTVFSTKWTALMYAAQNSQPDIVHLLLEKGADPNYNKNMYTVLMAACSSTSDMEPDILACINLLLDKDADVNAYDRYHMCSLIYATRKKRLTVVKRLIEAGANLDKQDNKGYTALMSAASIGHLRIVQALLEAGADTKKQSCDGSKAADMAFEGGHKQVEDLIKAKDDPSRHIELNDISSGDETSVETVGKLSMQSLQSGSNQEIYRYGDLELFLSGLELSNLIPTFIQHEVKFQDLLRMTDRDLQQMGIHQMGVRKKILDAIRDTHKKSWETSSINEVQYNKKITCAEAIAMVTNIKRHATYIGSSIGYITDQIKANKDILVNTQDGSGAEELSIQSEEAITNVRNLYEELVMLRAHLTEVAHRTQYKPPDLIKPKSKKTRSTYSLSVSAVLVGMGLCGLVYYKKTVISGALQTLVNKVLSPNL